MDYEFLGTLHHPKPELISGGASVSGWQIDIQPLKGVASLAPIWRELEARAAANFFLSWTWIGCWLETIAAQSLLLSVSAEDRIVALGLLVESCARRHVLIHSRQLHLNETGSPDIDRITIEHNGLLIDREIPQAILAAAVFQHLRMAVDVSWDECVLGGVPLAYVDAARTAGLTVEIDRRSPCFTVDLHSLRSESATMLSRVSRNTRAQIQRSIRAASKDGPVAIEVAANVPKALEFFDAMKMLHSARWQSRGTAGAFSTPTQNAFHRRLISRGVPKAEVELLRATAGTRVLGYLYNFIYGGRVYNYQCGFVPEPDNRHRPGLVTHYLACERAKAAGLDVYDLLAGDARYKRSIAKPNEELVWCRIQKPNPLLIAERLARRIKGRLLGS
jgi:CelD/BcsL family acetyltransferase involved in cellulose biosynthesis